MASKNLNKITIGLSFIVFTLCVAFILTILNDNSPVNENANSIMNDAERLVEQGQLNETVSVTKNTENISEQPQEKTDKQNEVEKFLTDKVATAPSFKVEYFAETDISYPFRARVNRLVKGGSTNIYEITLITKYNPLVNIDVPLIVQSDLQISEIGDVYQVYIKYDSKTEAYVITEAKNITFYD